MSVCTYTGAAADPDLLPMSGDTHLTLILQDWAAGDPSRTRKIAALQLWACGWCVREIARLLGRDHSRVSRWIRHELPAEIRRSYTRDTLSQDAALRRAAEDLHRLGWPVSKIALVVRRHRSRVSHWLHDEASS